MEKILLIVIRVIFGFFLLTTVVGWLWFSDYIEGLETLYMFMLSVALFTTVITPYKNYSSKNNVIVSFIYMLGISSIVFIVYGYFQSTHEVNYFGVVAHVFIGGLMIIPLRLTLRAG